MLGLEGFRVQDLGIKGYFFFQGSLSAQGLKILVQSSKRGAGVFSSTSRGMWYRRARSAQTANRGPVGPSKKRRAPFWRELSIQGSPEQSKSTCGTLHFLPWVKHSCVVTLGDAKIAARCCAKPDDVAKCWLMCTPSAGKYNR